MSQKKKFRLERSPNPHKRLFLELRHFGTLLPTLQSAYEFISRFLSSFQYVAECNIHPRIEMKFFDHACTVTTRQQLFETLQAQVNK